MEAIYASLQGYFQYFPLFAFIALLLAGLNIPFSEDLLIIQGAVFCSTGEVKIVPCLVLLLAGVIISDFMSYGIGRLVKRGAIKIKFIRSVIESKYAEKLRMFVQKRGMLTFIVCRFIPFGVRNTLFMSCGFLELKLRKFSLFDITAALISVNTLFWLIYFVGESVGTKIKNYAGYGLFFILAFVILTVIMNIIRSAITSRKHKHETD